MVPVECYFVLSALLFFIGVYGFVTRRNLIAMLISIELVLNAVDINFAAFNRLLFPGEFEGFFMTLFSMGVSAAESAVAAVDSALACAASHLALSPVSIFASSAAFASVPT